MSPGKHLHCYIEKKHGIWQAFCLDFMLAAQGESFEESREKLKSMVKEYIDDAKHGENQKYAEQLLSRRAPVRYWWKYYLYKALWYIDKLRNDANRRIDTNRPLPEISYAMVR
uniref:Uncharacterized protein n=1 Tax=Candidatus Kentrum sp. LFY TaxID=2126342 RepID=A0A450UA90_9GAMM|nr:MAG: hypothetical protein BECKLFY1418A_GA0070994_100623 [Candidatus Kentron sp. LFY]